MKPATKIRVITYPYCENKRLLVKKQLYKILMKKQETSVQEGKKATRHSSTMSLINHNACSLSFFGFIQSLLATVA